MLKTLRKCHAPILGWCGMSLIVGGYLLTTNFGVSPKEWWYLAMNIVGSALFGYELYTKVAWSGVCLQTVWIIIAIAALVH